MSRIVPNREQLTPQKRKKVTAETKAAREKWRDEQPPTCMVCSNPATEVDHVLGGSSRVDCVENWLLVCRTCHSEKHDRGGRLALFIACKRLRDEKNFSCVRLTEIYGRPLPDEWHHIVTAMQAFRDYEPTF